ncbi:hypothetical protein OH77DRAFT_566013 [Trametes cingulata]|nr:hypothetical protein OH77DRAFT_566013 [Trametes cingulata]
MAFSQRPPPYSGDGPGSLTLLGYECLALHHLQLQRTLQTSASASMRLLLQALPGAIRAPTLLSLLHDNTDVELVDVTASMIDHVSFPLPKCKSLGTCSLLIMVDRTAGPPRHLVNLGSSALPHTAWQRAADSYLIPQISHGASRIVIAACRHSLCAQFLARTWQVPPDVSSLICISITFLSAQDIVRLLCLWKLRTRSLLVIEMRDTRWESRNTSPKQRISLGPAMDGAQSLPWLEEVRVLNDDWTHSQCDASAIHWVLYKAHHTLKRITFDLMTMHALRRTPPPVLVVDNVERTIPAECSLARLSDLTIHIPIRDPPVATMSNNASGAAEYLCMLLHASRGVAVNIVVNVENNDQGGGGGGGVAWMHELIPSVVPLYSALSRLLAMGVVRTVQVHFEGRRPQEDVAHRLQLILFPLSNAIQRKHPGNYDIFDSAQG